MVYTPDNFRKTRYSHLAMGSSFRITRVRSTRARGGTVSGQGMVASFKIMDSFMRVDGKRIGLMVMGVSDTL
jgi:hypothetical protein